MITITNEDNINLMARYADNHFDLAIVDPPYNLQRFRNGIGKNDRHKVKSNADFNNEAPTNEYWDELFRVSKNQIVWGANNFVMPPSEYFLIWNKKQTVDNFASAEYAWVSMGLKKPAKVFDYGIHLHNHTDKIHPTQKPVPLYKFILKTYANEGDKILDTHLGSGSIAIACIDYNFDLTACEKSEKHFIDAQLWIKQHQSQTKLF